MTRWRNGRNRHLPGSVYGPPILITSLTLAAIVAALVLSNLPGSGADDGPRLLGWTGHEAPATNLGPDIHFAASGVDLGTVPLGKEVSFAFSYANIGSEPLRVIDAQVRVLDGC